jgi:hypothetical protein
MRNISQKLTEFPFKEADCEIEFVSDSSKCRFMQQQLFIGEEGFQFYTLSKKHKSNVRLVGKKKYFLCGTLRD